MVHLDVKERIGSLFPEPPVGCFPQKESAAFVHAANSRESWAENGASWVAGQRIEITLRNNIHPERIVNRETAVDIHNQCSGCSGGSCPVASSDQEPVLQGWRLSLASLAFFFLPLIGALVGAVCVRGSADLQLAGTLAGLVVGLVAGGVVGRAFVEREASA
jgi:hypothetical protein